MEISEIVNQSGAYSNERPFCCRFDGCNKSFGKAILEKTSRLNNNLAYIFFNVWSTKLEDPILCDIHAFIPMIDLSSVVTSCAIAALFRYVCRECKCCRAKSMLIHACFVYTKAISLNSTHENTHRREATCMRISNMQQTIQ